MKPILQFSVHKAPLGNTRRLIFKPRVTNNSANSHFTPANAVLRKNIFHDVFNVTFLVSLSRGYATDGVGSAVMGPALTGKAVFQAMRRSKCFDLSPAEAGPTNSNYSGNLSSPSSSVIAFSSKSAGRFLLARAPSSLSCSLRLTRLPRPSVSLLRAAL